MDGEPINISWQFGKNRKRRWLDEGAGPWDQVHVELGQLSDGRWYSHTTERAVKPNAWAWPDRESAERDVERLKSARTGWVDVPASYNARREPEGELGPWRLVGDRWVLDD
jgi:hypothetical protein